MKNLFRALLGSLTVLAIVFFLYVLGENGQNSAAVSGNVYTKSVLTQGADINQLPTVISGTREAVTRPGSTLENSNDYKPPVGKGNLTSEPVTFGEPLSEKKYFSTELYPYRVMLSDELKEVYDIVYKNAIEKIGTFTLTKSTTQTGINDVMTAIYGDHPELFWLDTSYSYGYTDKGTVVSLTLKYNDTINDFEASKEKFENAAKIIIDEALKLESDLEKETYVYHAIMKLCQYDESSELNQSAYSALVNGKSVCAGYARSFQYIMIQLGIPTYFCSGYANEGYHAWNIVRIDGKFYNVDISWDDSLDEITGADRNMYFNVPDSIMSIDHTRRELSIQLPKCE